MARYLALTVALALLPAAAQKPPPAGRGETETVELTATLFHNREALRELLGTDLDGHYIVVRAQVRSRFGREIEAVLGASARYPTANRQALRELSWSSYHLGILEEAMREAVGFREVAGGYYTARNITNAVRRVINNKTDPRETILDYARLIDKEIASKRREFGLSVAKGAGE